MPLGMVIGYFIVKAEPAVYVLMKQVEELTDGAISGKSIQIGLSVGVAVSVGISMLRVLTGISIFCFSGARLCHCLNPQPVCSQNFLRLLHLTLVVLPLDL